MIPIEFIKNYGSLENYLKLFEETNNYILKVNQLNAEVNIKSINETINFSEQDLNKLCNGKQLKIPELDYLEHCGYTYKRFGEISISVFQPKYSFIKDIGEWNTKPLKFKIEDKTFEIGPASPLFVLFNEPIYRDSDWQYDFHEFPTLKIINTNKSNIKDDAIKALYYLNSHYLKQVGLAARIYHMKIIEDDFLTPWENNKTNDILNRIRIRTRKNFNSIEPLILYNKAQTIDGEHKFLYLYRILEFFMHRAKIRKVNELRFDANVTDLSLLKTIEIRNEEKQLENLVKATLSNSQKKKISWYAHKKGFISEDSFNFLTKALYKYRNSIVHAKEQQIDNTMIPDPFKENFDIQAWIYIVDEIAIKCVRKYNTTSG